VPNRNTMTNRGQVIVRPEWSQCGTSDTRSANNRPTTVTACHLRRCPRLTIISGYRPGSFRIEEAESVFDRLFVDLIQVFAGPKKYPLRSCSPGPIMA
jgi:hypothetical protein